jgi:hypothetical protein
MLLIFHRGGSLHISERNYSPEHTKDRAALMPRTHLFWPFTRQPEVITDGQGAATRGATQEHANLEVNARSADQSIQKEQGKPTKGTQ